MGRVSATQRSLKYLQKQGYTTGIVERWHAFAFVRQDFLGFIDLISVKKNETVGVQTTSYAGISSHRAKIFAEKRAKKWVKAGNKIVLHGWKKIKGRWNVIIEDLTMAVRYNDPSLVRRITEC